MTRFLLVLLALNLNPAFAHAGHNHIPKANENIFTEYLDQKFKFDIGDNHIGHFFIRKAKPRKNGNYELRLDQTFHLDPDITIEKVKAIYTKDGILTYTAKADSGELFHIYTDFNEKDGEPNTGSRTRFLASNGSRMVTVEEFTLTKLVEDSETEDHVHD